MYAYFSWQNHARNEIHNYIINADKLTNLGGGPHFIYYVIIRLLYLHYSHHKNAYNDNGTAVKLPISWHALLSSSCSSRSLLLVLDESEETGSFASVALLPSLKQNN